jgi:hypothetical protein
MWQKVPLLYSCGFQNTWVISMVLPFIAEFGVLEGPIFSDAVALICSEEIPKLKPHINDTRNA